MANRVPHLKKYGPIILIVIIGILFRFWDINNLEVQEDHAINSFRALGYIDYLGEHNQTTPIIWFDSIPWWSTLSFHDHPPLSFAVQHLFFTILGDSDFTAHLPFLITDTLTIVCLYLLLREAASERTALLGSLLYAVSSLAIWTSRAGYLEGMATFLITLTMWGAYRYARNPKLSTALLWSGALAGSLLTKYTALFLVPGSIVYFALYQKRFYARKNFWLALAGLLVILSPAIIYNSFLLQTRGHLDSTLTSMLGMKTDDFVSLATRSINSDLISNIRTMLIAYAENTSLPLVALACIAIGTAVWLALRKKCDEIRLLALIMLIMIIGMFSVSGASPRFILILLPSMVLLIAPLLDQIIGFTEGKRSRVLIVSAWIGIGVILATEGAYAASTSLAINPIGPRGITYGTARLEDNGYQRLDRHLVNQVFTRLPAIKKVSTKKDLEVIHAKDFNNVIIYDDRLNWFSFLWYIRRYQLYYDQPLIPFSYLFTAVREANYSGNNVFTFLYDQGARQFHCILANGTALVEDQPDDYDTYLQAIQKALDASKAPTTNIYAKNGEHVFTVYEISL